ncbi:SDR family NAD(P)-dependent oxidoreductase [Thermogemmatispora sp.]|uniref:SDR family NAD(P)-dependent oxidoreductase n=1 Tax=Thermogemmatispora sp. TaxID=1968838 RepID=UPI0035E452C4
MSKFHGAVAIVSGRAKGVGKATYQAFVQQGARVVIADNDELAGKQTEAALNQSEEVALYAWVDIALEEGVEAMVRRAALHCGRVDVLVNWAAVFIMRGIEATVEEWQRIMDVNVMGQALCVKHVVPEMIKVGKGAVVSITSISSSIAQPHCVSYSATKEVIMNMNIFIPLCLAEKIFALMRSLLVPSGPKATRVRS